MKINNLPLGLTLPVTNSELMVNNLKQNILFVLSAFAFNVLNCIFFTLTCDVWILPSWVMFLPSWPLILFVFSQITNLKEKLSTLHIGIKIYAALSAFGFCFLFISSFVEIIFAVILSCLSSVSVFVFTGLLLDFVVKVIKSLLESFHKIELIIYGTLLLLLFIYVIVVFCQTTAFYGAPTYDIVYTSDSSRLTPLAYLFAYHNENDFRQPLFAVFSFPFTGFWYVLSEIFPQSQSLFLPLTLNLVQVTLMFISNLMLAKMISEKHTMRICFVLLLSVSYMVLLFSLMMEQYLIAYFWMVFAIYYWMDKQRASIVALVAASGTLTSTLFLSILMWNRNSNSVIVKAKQAISVLIQTLLGLLCFIVLFGKLDLLSFFFARSHSVSRFVGGTDFIARINQYTTLINSCFVSPSTCVTENSQGYISYQLSSDVLSSISIFGIVIFVLCITSFVIHKKNELSQISFAWICLSIFSVVIVGWGSTENGVVLYALYFGWAYFVLLFQLIVWLSQKIKKDYLAYIISSVMAIYIIVANFYGIKNLIDFAIEFYPV